jgi:hypothetical protein
MLTVVDRVARAKWVGSASPAKTAWVLRSVSDPGVLAFPRVHLQPSRQPNPFPLRLWP